MSFLQDFSHRSILTSSVIKPVKPVKPVFRDPLFTRIFNKFRNISKPIFQRPENKLSIFTTQPPRGPFPPSDPFSPADGFAGAPVAGLIPHPNALVLNNTSLNEFGVTYVSRPPWKVVGVDYGIGPPSGTIFKTPGVDIDPSGTSSNGSTHLMTVTGSSVVIDGWDFTISNGWGIRVTTGTDVTIQNCKFKVGSNGIDPIYFDRDADRAGITHGTCVIKNNVIDGNNSFSTTAVLMEIGNGQYTITYNWMKNSWSDFIQTEAVNGTNTFVVKYNVLENSNMDNVDTDVHGDWWQTFGGTYTNAVFDYNLGIQNNAGGTGAQNSATQGVTFGGNTGAPIFTTGSMSNNTIITRLAPSTLPPVTHMFDFEPFQITNSLTVSNNYFDTTGIGFATDFNASIPGYPAWIYIDSDSSGQNGGLAGSGNITMSDVTTRPGRTFLLAAGSTLPFPTYP